MIYEETYQYLLRNVSSTEFDTCSYALLHSDWDGVIQSQLHMMARGVRTTEKYLRQIIHKFTALQGSLKKVFVSHYLILLFISFPRERVRSLFLLVTNACGLKMTIVVW
ncbi:hypothetical protein N0U24_02870 [Peribacillus frigoritolerans]|uniref:hypothetical protein n=1 Tax=Peribacillus frigoritolerans TaxID=450367 RepID=UPI0021A979D7|nr:hypothetical protein [Peribacillus frigoritolerans]MCT4476095.1 hypothetical protein [Peribacillus frigoritolerans]